MQNLNCKIAIGLTETGIFCKESIEVPNGQTSINRDIESRYKNIRFGI